MLVHQRVYIYISTISYILTNQRGAKQVPLEFEDFPIRCPLKFEIRPTCLKRCSDINIGRNDSQFEGLQNWGYPKTDGLKWKIL